MSAKTESTRARKLQLCEDLVKEIQNYPNSKLCLKMALLQSDINTLHLAQIISNFRATVPTIKNTMSVQADNIRPGDFLLTPNV